MNRHPNKIVRKIVQIGKCSGITLPKEYLEDNNLKRGDRVELIYNGNLLVKSIRVDEIERELAEASA